MSQVHNVGSHVGNDSWAWDFRMPEGTPVVAALDGVVRLARGDSDEGGCDPAMARKANYVVIESPGSVETQYLHFSAVSVVPGQHVRRGDLLGYSGKTGWACGAHLHFKVATPVSAGWNNPSVEARLQGYGDPALEAWVSSPPCTAPLEVATHQPPPTVRRAPRGLSLRERSIRRRSRRRAARARRRSAWADRQRPRPTRQPMAPRRARPPRRRARTLRPATAFPSWRRLHGLRWRLRSSGAGAGCLRFASVARATGRCAVREPGRAAGHRGRAARRPGRIARAALSVRVVRAGRRHTVRLHGRCASILVNRRW